MLMVHYLAFPPILPHSLYSLTLISRDNPHASNSSSQALLSGEPQLRTPDAPFLPVPQFSPCPRSRYFPSCGFIKVYLLSEEESSLTVSATKTESYWLPSTSQELILPELSFTIRSTFYQPPTTHEGICKDTHAYRLV